MRSYLQILGLGEGKKSGRGNPGSAVAATTAPPRPPGRYVTDHERAQMARLAQPVPVASAVDQAEEIVAAAAVHADGNPDWFDEPRMEIHTHARPAMALSLYRPPSGGARNPQTDKPC